MTTLMMMSLLLLPQATTFNEQLVQMHSEEGSVKMRLKI